MADKLVEAEKARTKAEKAFEAAEDAMEKAVKKSLAEKGVEKKLGLVKHVISAAHALQKAGEDFIAAQRNFDKADK